MPFLQVTIEPSKSMDSAKPIYKYLTQQNSQVVELITQGRALHKLEKLLKPIINQYIGEQWRIGSLSREELTVIVYTAELANRLRFHSVKLLREVRRLESFKILNKINIKVNPIYSDSKRENNPELHHTLTPSKTGYAQLMSLADMVDDQALRESLQRLARHLQP